MRLCALQLAQCARTTASLSTYSDGIRRWRATPWAPVPPDDALEWRLRRDFLARVLVGTIFSKCTLPQVLFFFFFELFVPC